METRSSEPWCWGGVLARNWGPASHVGLLVPPTVPAAVANLAVTLWGKVPVNLNYSASQGLVDASIDQCGITHVLTSAKVLDRFKITPKGQLDPARGHPASRCGWPTSSGPRPSPSWCRSGLMGAFVPGLRHDQSGRDGDRDLHLGIDRRSQGGRAVASQRPLQRPSGRGAGSPEARGGAAGRPAVFPFVRLHDHDLDGHLPEQEGGLSLQPARCPDDRQALRGAQGDAA